MATTSTGEVLRLLLFDMNMKVADLARATRVSQPTIQRMIAGTIVNPQNSSLKPLADFFNISLAQLKGEQPISWLKASRSQLKHFGVKQVPLIDWTTLPAWLEDESLDIQNFDGVSIDSSVAEKAFALKVKDASMEPVFPIGSLVIFDPAKPIQDRCYALIKLQHHKDLIFRQLILDAGDKFIKPLSPDIERFSTYMLKDCDVIHAVLVEAKQMYL